MTLTDQIMAQLPQYFVLVKSETQIRRVVVSIVDHAYCADKGMFNGFDDWSSNQDVHDVLAYFSEKLPEIPVATTLQKMLAASLVTLCHTGWVLQV